MAPNFLSKFVKTNGTTSSDLPRQRTTSEFLVRGRTISGAINTDPAPPLPPKVVLTTDDTNSPVQPMSPGSIHRADSPRGGRSRSVSLTRSDRSKPTPISTPRKQTQELLDMPHTTSPTEGDIRPPGLAVDLTPSSSRSNITAAAAANVPNGSEENIKRKTSSRSLRSLNGKAHDDAASDHTSQRRSSIAAPPSSMQPIVESPTSEQPNFLIDTTTSMTFVDAGSSNPTLPSSSTSSSLQARADSDAVSIKSTGATSQGKKMPWRRSTQGSTKKRKPTGLASAIAASGLAMANPAVNMGQPIAPFGARPQSPPRSSPPQFPRRNSQPRSRQTSASYTSNGEENGAVFGDSFTDMDSDSEDELDLNGDDIPVTGFAVASSKRNADFHELFPSVPEGDYLIEDYGCALQREILIQGRFYISENHICFHANIFGWITNLIIPVYEIISIEKKMTAFVIPNAIQITSRTAKYTFASFLSRDTTYDVIHNIWRLARPDGDSLGSEGASPRMSIEEPVGEPPGLDAAVLDDSSSALNVSALHNATLCLCGKEGKHYPAVAMDTVFPGTPEKIYNLMFASGFIKDFMREDQKLRDVQISDWCPDPETKLLSRNFSYIKPLSGGVGPRQTKCELKDETLYCDFNNYVTTLTTTRSPDVPSGAAFTVKTRTCIMWASPASSHVIITTVVEWTGRSFIKSIIEKSALEGQKSYHNDLERAMRRYIAENKAEFIPEGLETLVASTEDVVMAPVDAAHTVTPVTTGELLSEVEANKRREHERNQRATQWAFDTIMGAWMVAKQSTSDALDLVSDAWDQSSSTTILWFVIVVLVFSNVWTLVAVGRREEVGRRKEMIKIDEQKKWVQSIVAALWEERAVGFAPHAEHVPQIRATDDWRGEVAEISRALDVAEERIRNLRRSLGDLD